MQYFGYYLGDGKVGNHTSEFFPYTNLYMAWVYNGYYKGDSEDSYYLRMQNCVDRAAENKKWIYLGLNGQRPADRTEKAIRRAVKICTPHKDLIVAVDIGDEIADLSRQETKALIRKVRDIIISEWGVYKPLGLTFTTDQSLYGDLITIDLLDFVNLECYTDYQLKFQDRGPDANLAYVRTSIERARERLDPDMKVWYTLQGFDRNNQFKMAGADKVNEDNLADLNYKSYKVTKVNYRTEGWLVFNYARPTTKNGLIVPGSGGTKFYPKVKQVHMNIAKELGIVA